MKIKDGFILREVAGSSVVVPIGKAAADFNGMVTLNEVSAFLWKQLEQDVTEADLLARLLEHYEIDEKTAQADIADFIAKLKKDGFVEG